ncbi:uL30 family ribosomal protein [Candidatus Woesearchaeota archaeon]|nr:uL30 family ribosomal protein [Candidatus Woesearchaeota archaeon]
MLKEAIKEVERIEGEGKKEVVKDVKKEKPEEKQKKSPNDKIGIIRIRGGIGINKNIKDTLDMLKLHKKHFCVIIENTPSNMGMIKKAKDYITWGELNEDTIKELISKRSEPNPKDPKRTKKFFRLNSPKKGYERKGIKVPFSVGGALGYRKDKINDLIKRML